MKKTQLENFAELLIRQVRDEAVRSCDQQLESHAQSPIAKRWRSDGLSPKGMIPDCIDETIFQLLRAMDEGLIRFTFCPPGEEPLDLTDGGGGELAGKFMGSGGWRSIYSAERFNDDFTDLT